MGYRLITLLLAALLQQLTFAETAHMVDYTHYGLEIKIEALRAGNHNTVGKNEYQFQVEAHAFDHTNDPSKKVSKAVGSFGEVQIPSLAVLTDSELKALNHTITVPGDFIRQIISLAMAELNADEQNVAVEIEITMIKLGKKFLVMSDHQTVAQISFWPIPTPASGLNIRENQEIKLTDGKSAAVKFTINYPR